MEMKNVGSTSSAVPVRLHQNFYILILQAICNKGQDCAYYLSTICVSCTRISNFFILLTFCSPHLILFYSSSYILSDNLFPNHLNYLCPIAGTLCPPPNLVSYLSLYHQQIWLKYTLYLHMSLQ